MPPDEEPTEPVPPPAGAGLPPVRVFGDYEIVSELGRGGMGIVYRARQKKLKRTVALKMLTGHFGKEEMARFIAEAETVAQLHHSNIVHIYEVGEEGGIPFFSMEYIEAGTLTERLRMKELTVREAAELMLPVARAVHFAHEHGIVHRDLKPGNVLLDAQGAPKVVDFGIAKRLHDDASLTLTGVVVGTPTYMAPEQAKGSSRSAGPTADVYSLGAILYEMLTGRPPFLPDESDTALTMRVITEEPVSPAWHRSDIPRELEAICMMCLQKDPKDRFQSAGVLADDLKRYLNDEPILAKPPTRIRRTVKWMKRHPGRAALYALGLMLLGAGIQRVWEWDRYEREHVIYTAGYELIFGEPKPLKPLSEAERGKATQCLRITRRGRVGKVTRLEMVNSRGHSAVVRRITGGDAMPMVLQGAGGVQSPDERTPEVVSVHCTYAGDRISELTGQDRNDQVQWRIQFDQSSADARSATARFATMRGFEFGVVQGATHARFERDERGRESRVRFYNSRGRPAQNGEGVYGYAFERNEKGFVTRMTNLDAADRPMKNRVGEVMKVFTYNAGGRLERAETRDARGEPVTINGILSIVSIYDAQGNMVRVENRDKADRLISSQANGIAAIAYERNERGELVKISILKLQTDGNLTPLSETRIAYDQWGHPSEKQVKSANGWRSVYENDARGNMVMIQWLTVDGKPGVGPDGWSMLRYKRGPSPTSADWQEEENYYDVKGGKSWAAGGFHHRLSEYNEFGSPVRTMEEDYNETITAFYRYESEREFDQAGRLIRMVGRFLDAKGEPVSGPTVYSGVESEYDEEGREFRVWHTGHDPESSGAPVWLTETVWGVGSLKKKETRQACDAEKMPLEVTVTGVPARVEKTFDDFGRQMVRQVESGFPVEKGFYYRELTIDADGRLAQVVRRTKERTVLPQERVQVLVRQILDGAPETSLRLKVGDEVVSVNGRAVTTMYMFGDGKGANGGAVEVRRNGELLKFENFAPGPLGILMEEVVK